MSPTRLTALIVGLSVTAVACGGGAAIDAANPTSAPDSSAPDSSGSTSSGSGSAAPDTPSGSIPDPGSDAGDNTVIELFSPTDTDKPLDLSGGVSSSSEGVTIVTETPRDQLRRDVLLATGFFATDWTRQTIDPEELLLGIQSEDPRDRIPPIDTPRFEPLASATWLSEREPGALVQFNDEVRFYPLSILTRHEIVNDRFGDVPVVVTFCPLCNTAITFDARVDGQALRFGVSGLLRKSDLVMWDDKTTSLWQQITGEAVIGEFAGTQLDLIPTSIVSYGDALGNFPDALSLSRDTGFNIAYGSNPYVGYSSSSRPFLFDGETNDRFPALSRVVGVSLGESDKAYPFSLISEMRAVNDELDGVPIAVLWGGDTADALDSSAIADSQSIGSGIAFSREVDGTVLTFSSLGDDLFADAETGTTWTLLGRAIDGPLVGEQLQTVQHRNEFWFAWSSFFPDAPVYGDA